MNAFVLILVSAGIAAAFSLVGALLAERIDPPQRVISSALQFAAGILTAMVAFTLMPSAVRGIEPAWLASAFFAGGALFIGIEYGASRLLASDSAAQSHSIGLHLGILLDLLIDGAAIGIGAAIDLTTGIHVAIGVGIHSLPLVFVMIATAGRQGLTRGQRLQLTLLAMAALIVGAMIGFIGLQGQSPHTVLVLTALMAGFLFTTITQSMIPEATRKAETSFLGLVYMGGLALFALISLSGA